MTLQSTHEASIKLRVVYGSSRFLPAAADQD